jgi:hypothetical protein
MKHTAKMYVQGKRDYTNKMEYHLHSGDMTDYGYVTVGTIEVEFEVPDDFNPVQAEIEMLKHAKAKVESEAMSKMRLIEDQIRNLQCLEYKPL